MFTTVNGHIQTNSCLSVRIKLKQKFFNTILEVLDQELSFKCYVKGFQHWEMPYTLWQSISGWVLTFII